MWAHIMQILLQPGSADRINTMFYHYVLLAREPIVSFHSRICDRNRNESDIVAGLLKICKRFRNKSLLSKLCAIFGNFHSKS